MTEKIKKATTPKKPRATASKEAAPKTPAPKRGAAKRECNADGFAGRDSTPCASILGGTRPPGRAPRRGLVSRGTGTAGQSQLVLDSIRPRPASRARVGYASLTDGPADFTLHRPAVEGRVVDLDLASLAR